MHIYAIVTLFKFVQLSLSPPGFVRYFIYSLCLLHVSGCIQAACDPLLKCPFHKLYAQAQIFPSHFFLPFPHFYWECSTVLNKLQITYLSTFGEELQHFHSNLCYKLLGHPLVCFSCLCFSLECKLAFLVPGLVTWCLVVNLGHR